MTRQLKDVPIAELRRMVRKPMTPFEVQDVAHLAGRCALAPNEKWASVVYVNNRYSVQASTVATEIGEVLHLWIRRHDGEMPRAWSDLQRIKNAIAGESCTAVEVFPPQSELVDSANMAHLWVYPPGWVMPFRLQP